MFRLRKNIILKEDSPNSYKIFIKCAKQISLFLALVMLFTSINWDAFVPKAENFEEIIENYLNQSTDPYAIPISFEDTTKRDAYTKHFRKLDGSYEASVYDEAVHYLSENEYKQIDNSFLYDSKAGEYENKDNSFKFKLPKKIHENKAFKLSYDNYKIEWTISYIEHAEITVIENEKSNSNNLRLVENVYQQAIYKNIQENVDLEYIIVGQKIKENIILNSYIENYSVKYHFKLKDLELKELAGEIVFVNNLNEVIFSLGSFIMYDSNFNESSDIDVQIINSKNKEYELIITPSDSWLKKSTFPIIIDPTFVITSNGASPLRDKYTYGSQSVDSNYLMVGRVSSAVYKSYIELNLKNIKSKPVITYANLQLDIYNNDNYCDINCQINVKEVYSGILFNNIPLPTDNITVPDVVDYVMVNKNNKTGVLNFPVTTYLWDITKLVQKWKYNDQEIGILELSDDKNNDGKYVRFDSANYSTGIRPQVTIGYVEQSGLNDYWTYHSQSAGVAGIGYVNDYTGNLTFVHNDYTPFGDLFSFGISHIYNLDDKDVNIGYGKGWRLNLNYEFNRGDGNQMYFRDADGSIIYFYEVKSQYDTTFIAEDGSGMRISFSIDENEVQVYLLELPDGTTLRHVIDVFYGVEEYTIITDSKTSGSYRIDYDMSKDKVTKVTDEAGNEAIFNYYDNKNLEKIIINRKNKIDNLETYKEIRFYYGINDNLTQIKHYYMNQETKQLVSEDSNIFQYDSYNRLIDIKNTFDNGLSYDYVSPIRHQVDEVRLYNYLNGVKSYISKVDINYSFKQTTFTDDSGDYVTYTFDNYGHTINIVDNKGNAQYYKYYDLLKNIPLDDPSLVNWNLNHKINHISTIQKNNFSANNVNYTDDRVNLIINPSFETNASGWTLSGATREVVPTNEIINNILGDYAIKIAGDGSTTKYFSQDIYINGYSGDSFVFGGWSKGYTQPSNYQSQKKYRIALTIYEYYYTTEIKFKDVCEIDPETFSIDCKLVPERIVKRVDLPQTYYLDLNSNIIDWQYLMSEIKTTNSYDKINIKVEYSGEGTVYFDGLQLYKEEFGTGYTYYGQDNLTVSEENPVDLVRDGKLKTIDAPSDKADYVITYNNNGDVESITDASGKKTNLTYSGRKIDTIIQNNVKVSFNYNYNADYNYDLESITIGDSLYFTMSTIYAHHWQFTSTTTDQYGNTTNYDYDPVTGLLKSLKYKDANGEDVITSYRYDAFGRLIKIEKDIASNEYIYVEGKLKYILVNGFFYEFDYDEFNRIKNVYVNNQKLMGYDYYPLGQNGRNQIHHQYYGNGDKIEFIYDDEHRIQAIKFNNEVRFHYEYDYANRFSKYFDYVNGDVFTYKYDLNGRLNSIVDQENNTISLNYNADDGKLKNYNYTLDGKSVYEEFYYSALVDFKGMLSQTKITIDNKTISKEYKYSNDSLKRLNNIVLSLAKITINQNFIYDDESVVHGNASTRIKTISYDINGLSYTYAYDNTGNIKDIIVKENNDVVEEYHYIYDKLNQLIREDVNTSKEQFTKVIEYDNNGNIVLIKKYDFTTTKNPTGENETIRYYYSDFWKDQLTKIEKVKNGEVEVLFEFLDYDNLGNPTQIKNFNYEGNIYHHAKLEYDGRQLTRIKIYREIEEIEANLVVTLSYKYNDLGIRTEKQITTNGVTKTTKYFVDGDKVLQEKSDNIVIYYLYDMDGKLIGFSLNNNIYLYLRNLQGDITKIVDEQSKVIVQYTYDAWGKIIDTKEYDANGNSIELNIAKINPYRYRGYRYDEETGWYYLNSRYYNLNIGRFINIDGVFKSVYTVLSNNLYTYTSNNPTNCVDPSGYCEFAFDWDGDGHVIESGCGGANIINDIFNTDINSGAGYMYSTYSTSIRFGMEYGSYTTGLLDQYSIVKQYEGAGKADIGLSGRGYKPQPGERTLDGFVKNNVPLNKETNLYSNGQAFKRFGSESHGGIAPHVHQPYRNVAPNGNVYTGVSNSASSPTTRDVKQLYDFLFNGKYR